MGRPSVREERTAQIYEATIRCMRRHGSAGTTLERIAAEAGMSRGHVRHFAGNRDELIVATARYFYGLQGNQHPWQRGDEQRFAGAAAALSYLFGAEFTEPGDENAFVQQLIDQARTRPALSAVLVEAYSDLRLEIAHALSKEIPGVAQQDRDAASYAILSLALGNVFLADIDMGLARSDLARTAAAAIVDGLRRRSGGAAEVAGGDAVRFV